MREMKDSGVEWIGEMPAGWKTARVKNVAATMQSGGTPDSSNDSFYVDKEYGIPWVAIADMSATAYVTDTNKYISENARHSKNIKVFPPGTILYAMYASVGKVAELAVPATINQALLAIELRNNINNSFFKYALNAWEPYIISESNGTTQNNLNASKVANLFVPLPCLQEQEILARLLDLRRTKVDTLIQNVQTQIEKLKAYKQSLITEVVTKGLDPTVPMKDSGVEWLGKYPSHWAYMPFGYVLKERAEKNNPVVTQERLSLSIELGVTLYAEKTTNLDRFKDDFSQYKLAHAGDLVMNSMNMIVGATGVSAYFGCVSPAYYTFYDETDEHITAKFCEYVFRSKTMLRVLHSMGKGIYSIERGDDRINTCRLKVPKVDLKSLHIAIPPLEEQRSIVLHLNEKSNQIDRLISIKQAKIEKLEQYKRSLIYEYVTGKKEVRL